MDADGERTWVGLNTEGIRSFNAKAQGREDRKDGSSRREEAGVLDGV